MNKLALASAALVGALTASSAEAAPLLLAYSGGTFSAILNLNVTGGVATSISGFRNGVAITGLSTYSLADNAVSAVAPFVTTGGISYTITGGQIFNLYRIGSAYRETNSITDPAGTGVGPSNVFLIAAARAEISAGPVPEPATWALMLIGFGMVGYGLRHSRRRATRITYA